MGVVTRRQAGLAVANAAGILTGMIVDRAIGDPRFAHPVAAFGRAAGRLESRTYRPTRMAGLRHAATATGSVVLAASVVTLATRSRPLLRAAIVTGSCWAVVGARSLHREASAMADEIDSGRLAAARRRLPNLCGRDPATLDADGLVRATVESVAENTSDAVIAPLVWGALAGLPGLLGYRAINTLDAMVGHRTPRYRSFGTVAARLDDVANLVPARFTAALTVVAAPRVGGQRRSAWAAWMRDGSRHPSPNAGVCEAAMAGALGVSLGGRNAYAGVAEERPRLGDGPAPQTSDIRRAVALSKVVCGAAALLCAGHVLARPWRRAALRAVRRRLTS